MPRISSEEEAKESAELIAKLQYEDQASSMADQKDSLMMLYEMGFIDFETNKKMLLKHKDVNMVAMRLMEGNVDAN